MTDLIDPRERAERDAQIIQDALQLLSHHWSMRYDGERGAALAALTRLTALAERVEAAEKLAQDGNDEAIRLHNKLAAAEVWEKTLRAEMNRAARWLEDSQDPRRYAVEILRTALSLKHSETT